MKYKQGQIVLLDKYIGFGIENFGIAMISYAYNDTSEIYSLIPICIYQHKYNIFLSGPFIASSRNFCLPNKKKYYDIIKQIYKNKILKI